MSMQRIEFSPHNSNSNSRTGTVELPNECPWCYSKISPNIIGQNTFDYYVNTKSFQGSLLLECPNCKNHFHKSYDLEFGVNSNFTSKPLHKSPVPRSNFEYPKEVDTICPEFEKIISQTTHAEGLGLDHLAGIGYRKGIEFLVKDYLIELKNFEREKIESKQLGQCIRDIEDYRIQTLAKAATWIGNDETHYSRKHDRNINDMKRFLHALTLLVSLEKSVIDAEEFVDET